MDTHTPVSPDDAFADVLRALFAEYPVDESIPKRHGHTELAVVYRERALLRVSEGLPVNALGLATDTGVPNDILDAAYALLFPDT